MPVLYKIPLANGKNAENFSMRNSLFQVILVLTFLSITLRAQDAADYKIIKPASNTILFFSGDETYHTIGRLSERPIRACVLDKNNHPVEGVKVHFTFIKGPGKNPATVENELVVTNVNGIAETYVRLASHDGVYEFAARIYQGNPDNDIVYYRLYGRDSNWVFFLIIGLAGGLALFLFGMEMMSEGMKKVAGSRLRSILSSITNNRLVAVGMGTFVTMIMQSSSATTVMLVSFVQARLITFAQSLGIILGADIGTTFTAQLIALKLTDYALLMIAIGFLIFFIAKPLRYKNIGETILGFGILFFGMKIMSDAMYPLRTFEPFIDILLKLENPLFGILIGTIFTALIQSSGAFAGIIIVLATQGILTLEAGIPLLLGANMGTCITAFLASINTSREAKRVAIAHILFKVAGVLLFIWWIPTFADIIRSLSPGNSSALKGAELLADVVPHQIANAHTVFNVFLTLVMLPFTRLAAKWITRLFPDKAIETVSPYQTRFLDDSLLDTPTLALNLAKVEILRLGKKVIIMVKKSIDPFLSNHNNPNVNLDEGENEIDFIEKKIRVYLTRISRQNLDEQRVAEVFQMINVAAELEQIADIVSGEMKRLLQKKCEQDSAFSSQGKDEIAVFHQKTMKQINRALDLFKEVNLAKAREIEAKYKEYRIMEMDLRHIHYRRLQKDIPETVASSEIHVALIDLLKRISSHATNIARIMMASKKMRAPKTPSIN
ncbi:MAG: Na/Pi symporter [Calditrichae bacterium]|nr:Na/Pi symporter [Calditrichota bacterium]MCB9058000.1 Na/Pi symporter [Calditrichia bacterium]